MPSKRAVPSAASSSVVAQTQKNPHLTVLREQVSAVSTSPGVYKWLNEEGEVLYVGKAKNLRARLRSYVSLTPDAQLGPWKLALIGIIAGLEVTVTRTELEALILETNVIKELRPKYNVLMKDDKNYVYVRVAVHEAFPTVEVVRQMHEDKAKYYGPYLSRYETERALEVLHDLYHWRSCKKGLEQANRAGAAMGKTLCTEGQIGKCNGLCGGKMSQEEYRAAVTNVQAFFRGDRSEVRRELQWQMQEAAKLKQFERAARLRDALSYIATLDERQVVSGTSGEDSDSIGLARLADRAHIVVLRERGGKVVGDFSVALRGTADAAAEILTQFLPQFYSTTDDVPPQVYLGEDLPEAELLAEWLTERRRATVKLRLPERGRKSQLLLMAERNAAEKLRHELASWQAAQQATADALADLRERLALAEEPARIEGYDISHLGGTDTVGSMVVMRQGKAANDHYRSFTIRTLAATQVDDYAALTEVLRRRLRYVSDDPKTWLERLQEEGITFGKARKSEGEHYKQMLVFRKGDTVIAGARRLDHEDGTREISDIRVEEPYRAHRLEKVLIHAFLQRETKGKFYIAATAELADLCAEMGFRHIHEVPATLAGAKGEVMMIEAKNWKTDASLGSRPDLLVIDGGKGQLSAVCAVLDELKLAIPVIGLAKREEEVFLPNRIDPVLFPKDSPGKFLLMRLRDEAHRFANKHRTMKQKQHFTRSALDDVPGIGPGTRNALLRAFGSVEGVREASDEQLQQIVTVGQLKALRETLL